MFGIHFQTEGFGPSNYQISQGLYSKNHSEFPKWQESFHTLFWLASWVEKSSALVSSFPYYGPFGKWRKLFIKAVCHRVFITFTLYYVRPRDLEFGLVPTYAYMNLQYDMFWLNVVVCSNSDFSFISQVIDICLQKWKNFRFNLFEISF